MAAFHNAERSICPETIAKHFRLHPTPEPDNGKSVRDAVVLRCKIGRSMINEPEIIHITLVDYFNCEVLVDTFVFPTFPMMDWNTKQTGIRDAHLARAKKRRAYLRGRQEAREAVYRYVGPATIIVGYALHDDLRALRMLHPRVLDVRIIGEPLASWWEANHRPPAAQSTASEASTGERPSSMYDAESEAADSTGSSSDSSSPLHEAAPNAAQATTSTRPGGDTPSSRPEATSDEAQSGTRTEPGDSSFAIYDETASNAACDEATVPSEPGGDESSELPSVRYLRPISKAELTFNTPQPESSPGPSRGKRFVLGDGNMPDAASSTPGGRVRRRSS